MIRVATAEGSSSSQKRSTAHPRSSSAARVMTARCHSHPTVQSTKSTSPRRTQSHCERPCRTTSPPHERSAAPLAPVPVAQPSMASRTTWPRFRSGRTVMVTKYRLEVGSARRSATRTTPLTKQDLPLDRLLRCRQPADDRGRGSASKALGNRSACLRAHDYPDQACRQRRLGNRVGRSELSCDGLQDRAHCGSAVGSVWATSRALDRRRRPSGVLRARRRESNYGVLRGCTLGARSGGRLRTACPVQSGQSRRLRRRKLATRHWESLRQSSLGRDVQAAFSRQQYGKLTA